MSRLLYEKSVSYQGHLITPFVFAIADKQSIYSYKLLSELGHKGKFHCFDNPASIYSSNLTEIVDVAREHLNINSDVVNNADHFKSRYIYCDNLIIISQVGGKYFYDHYTPTELKNIAAPKIFTTEQDCINWIKQGLARSYTNQEVKKV